MKRSFAIILISFILLCVCFVIACGSGDDDSSSDSDDPGDDDTRDDDWPGSEVIDENLAKTYPPKLPFPFVRDDDSEPIPEDEMAVFSEMMREFYDEMEYVNWLLRMSHGMDDSTGMKDYRLWMDDAYGQKQGDTVSIIHKYYDEHGGHNILKGNSLVLGSAIAGYLKTGDEVLGELSRLYCNGISATMLGMVHDDQDPVRHLMARNVVTSNHTYTTHDGRKKFVDYSNWYHPYDRWNCSRFLYEDNPYWGEVWVTNTRSKDGLGYLFKAAVSVSHAAANANDPEVREACSETRDLLVLFARDIVENGYLIRSKDKDGNPYRPGVDPEPEEANVGDLASLVQWDLLFPEAECNATQAAALLGYGNKLDNDCEPFGGHKLYELGAMINNPPNGHIMRSFHIANISQALNSGDNNAALKALQGLEERFERDMNLDLSLIGVNPDAWFRDMALNLLQSASAGYYLTSDEVRLIHSYALRSMEEYRQWENWDLWADSVPEGEELVAFPPTGKTLEDETKRYWFRPNAMGMFMEYCWGLNRNPDSPKVIDCDMFGY